MPYSSRFSAIACSAVFSAVARNTAGEATAMCRHGPVVGVPHVFSELRNTPTTAALPTSCRRTANAGP